MPHWMVKALVQKAVSLLPMSHRINNFFQDHITHNTSQLTARFFEVKVTQGSRHIEEYLAATKAESLGNVLELGTGWYPIVPVVMYLAGASRVWTADRVDMLRLDRIAETLRQFLAYHRDGRLAGLVPRLLSERIVDVERALGACAADARPAEILSRLSIEYVPGDARHLSLPVGCADFIFSNLVIGFIPEEVLRDIMTEFRRLMAPAGAMSHFVDMTDLYALFDRRITPYNFLRYSKRMWRWLNNDIQYLNRLRITDYRRLHEQAGFRIVREDNDGGSLEQLDTVPLAKEFRHDAREDLAVRNSWIVSRLT